MGAAGAAGRDLNPLAVFFNPNGQHGNPDHVRTVRGLVQQAEREFPNRGRYSINEGTSIRNLTGINRRPDVWVIDTFTRRVVKVYEAARMLKSGQWVAREVRKLTEYTKSGLRYLFREVQ